MDDESELFVVVTSWDRRRLRFFVDAAVPDCLAVERKIRREAGVLLNTTDTADVILVGEDKVVPQDLLAKARAWDREIIVLYSGWVQACIDQAKLLGPPDNWGHYRVATEGMGLPKERASNRMGDVGRERDRQARASSSSTSVHYRDALAYTEVVKVDPARHSSITSTRNSSPARSEERSDLHCGIPSYDSPGEPTQNTSGRLSGGMNKLLAGASQLAMEISNGAASVRTDTRRPEVGPSASAFNPSNTTTSVSNRFQNMHSGPHRLRPIAPRPPDHHTNKGALSYITSRIHDKSSERFEVRWEYVRAPSHQAAVANRENELGPSRQSRSRPIRYTEVRKIVHRPGHKEVVLDESLRVPKAVPNLTGRGNCFTIAEEKYFCRQLNSVLDTQGEVTVTDFFRAFAEKLPHHSYTSWRLWYIKDKERTGEVQKRARVEEREGRLVRVRTEDHDGDKGKERAVM